MYFLLCGICLLIGVIGIAVASGDAKGAIFIAVPGVILLKHREEICDKIHKSLESFDK